MTWALLLARVFAIDVWRCLGCGRKLNPDTFEIVVDPLVVARILLALGLYAHSPPRAPPRCEDLMDDMHQGYAQVD